MARIYKKGREISDAKIATNSLAITSGDLITLSGGFVAKAGVGSAIEGVSKTEQTFAADNQTVAQDKVIYVAADDYLRLEMVTDADIAVANVGSTFALNADQTVDVATVGVGDEVRLEEVLTARLGVFSIVK